MGGVQTPWGCGRVGQAEGSLWITAFRRERPGGSSIESRDLGGGGGEVLRWAIPASGCSQDSRGGVIVGAGPWRRRVVPTGRPD